MTELWFSAADLAGLPGQPKTPQGVNARGDREQILRRLRSGRGGGWEYPLSALPAGTQAALIAKAGPGTGDQPAKNAQPSNRYDRDSLWANYERQTTAKKDRALARFDAVNEAADLIEFGVPRTQAWQIVAGRHDISTRTLRRLFSHVQDYRRDDWLAALVPAHRGNPGVTVIEPRVWEFFKADYLRLSKPAFKACYRRLQRKCEADRWTLPAETTLRRRITDLPIAVRTLLRDGEQALMRLYPPLERDVSQLHALEWVSADGYTHNVFVRWPDGTIGRPHTWFWQDVHSRKLLTWRVDRTENTDLIRLSFGDLIEQFGIPGHVVIDNTRGAANKWMTGGTKTRYRFTVRDDDPLGVFPLLDVKVHWTSVHSGRGHGQAKPIERHFGIGGIGEVVDKHPAFEGAWTGNKPTAKPENYASRAIPIEQFIQVLTEEVAAYNAQPKRRTQMCRNLHSFDHSFRASYERSPIRKATADQRRMCLLPAESVRVQRDGTVTLAAGRATGLGRNRYKADCLVELAGEKIVVRFDPQALHDFVHVYRLDGQYIGEASCIDPAGFGDTQRGREHNRARRQHRKATKLAAEAEVRMTALEVADQMPQTEAAEAVDAKVVQAFRPPKDIVRKPPPEQQLTAEQRADLDRLTQEMERERNAAPVIALRDMTPEQLFVRCERVFEQLERGGTVSDEDVQWAKAYRGSTEYRAMQELDEDFDFLNRQGIMT